MFKTETVYIHAPTSTASDPFGTPIEVDSDKDFVAVDVLVYDSSNSDVIENNRPSGRQITYGLHFPKTWAGGLLDNRLITVRGEVCKVVGAPRPKTPENTPGRWNMLVLVERSDG